LQLINPFNLLILSKKLINPFEIGGRRDGAGVRAAVPHSWVHRPGRVRLAYVRHDWLIYALRLAYVCLDWLMCAMFVQAGDGMVRGFGHA